MSNKHIDNMGSICPRIEMSSRGKPSVYASQGNIKSSACLVSSRKCSKMHGLSTKTNARLPLATHGFDATNARISVVSAWTPDVVIVHILRYIAQIDNTVVVANAIDVVDGCIRQFPVHP